MHGGIVLLMATLATVAITAPLPDMNLPRLNMDGSAIADKRDANLGLHGVVTIGDSKSKVNCANKRQDDAAKQDIVDQFVDSPSPEEKVSSNGRVAPKPGYKPLITYGGSMRDGTEEQYGY